MAGLTRIVTLEETREQQEKISVERRFFISSLAERQTDRQCDTGALGELKTRYDGVVNLANGTCQSKLTFSSGTLL